MVAYKDQRNYIEMQLDGKYLYRTEIVDGDRHDLAKLQHRIADNPQFVTFSLDVLPTSLVQRYSVSNEEWKILDSWEQGSVPSLKQARNFTDGKFGFFIPEGHDVELSNFSYYPKPR